MARESTMDKMVQEEKKSKGFPLFFRLKNFQTALSSDIKQWASRQCHHRRFYRRRHRRSRSKIENKVH
jgi:hypothetical protein